MTPQEANTVLSYCVAADPRLASSDADQATARVQVWADLLAPVDAQFALDHVRRFYASDQKWAAAPGAIRTAWRHEVTRRESIARAASLPEAGELHRPRSDTATEMLALARREAAQAAQRGVPERRPAKPLRLAPTAVFEGGHGHE